MPAVIRTSPEDERLQAALIENMVREDLNPVEEARACAALVDDLGISKEELARRVGRSRAAISNLIRLLDLPDPVLTLLERGELSEGHGRAILQVSDQDKRTRLAKQAAAARAGRFATPSAAPAARPARKKATAGGRISAEERAAMAEAEDLLGSALGQDVRVRRAGERGQGRAPASTTSPSWSRLARRASQAPLIRRARIADSRAISSVG